MMFTLWTSFPVGRAFLATDGGANILTDGGFNYAGCFAGRWFTIRMTDWMPHTYCMDRRGN